MINAIERSEYGIVICGDSTSTEVISFVHDELGEAALIISDPPYGNIVDKTCAWDKVNETDEFFSSWMINWTRAWAERCLLPAGAFYIWGGVGKPGFRPFLRYLSEVEQVGKFELANLITWKKRRGYGVQNNYLFTREECAYFIKGNAKKPRCFNVPLLDEKRGYAGYNAKYPARSEFYRRTNVWTDITEIMSGKSHPTQKAQRLHEVMIEVHTNPGDTVIDPFGGAGTTALAAKSLGRRYVIIENDVSHYENILRRLSSCLPAS